VTGALYKTFRVAFQGFRRLQKKVCFSTKTIRTAQNKEKEEKEKLVPLIYLRFPHPPPFPDVTSRSSVMLPPTFWQRLSPTASQYHSISDG
jgi:hypothetical protein